MAACDTCARVDKYLLEDTEGAFWCRSCRASADPRAVHFKLIKVGQWVVVAGQGPMRVGSVGTNPIKLFAPPGNPGQLYYGSLGCVVGPVTEEFLNTYEQDSAARGFDVSWVPEVRKSLTDTRGWR